MNLQKLMNQRKSARKFLKNPVSRTDIECLLKSAGAAPSALNLQPWEYVVAHGDKKDQLVDCLKKVHAIKNVSCRPGTSEPLPKNIANRGRKALYVLKPLVEKSNIPFKQFIEEGSCSLYGAPVVIIVLIDKIFPKLRYLDVGLSISYLLLAAEEKGLSTCPITFITEYGEDIKKVMNISDKKEVVMAIALGHADKTAPENEYKSDRVPLNEILTWFE